MTVIFTILGIILGCYIGYRSAKSENREEFMAGYNKAYRRYRKDY
jgi:hypothetical protein